MTLLFRYIFGPAIMVVCFDGLCVRSSKHMNDTFTHTHITHTRPTHTHTPTQIMSNSTIKDEAKKNARKNILQAIGGSVSPPPTKVAMTIPTAREPSPDDIAQDNKLRVANAVKNLQSELKKEPRPLPPAIKPRKSPTTSPSRYYIYSGWVIFVALNFRGLLKQKHSADFSF